MNKETIKVELTKADIISRLYRIQNIAVLISNCPDNKADVCVLQGAAECIIDLINNMIDDIDVSGKNPIYLI